LDLVVPTAVDPVALHVFVHGGYWQDLSKAESFFAAPGTLAQGIAFAALDYTLAPHADMDQIVAEVIAALWFLRRQATGLGIDPARIVVSGSSAGAHLAAMAAVEMSAEEQPARLILLSGIYDLRPLRGTYVNDALAMSEACAVRNSPALRACAHLPACGIAWAQNDTDEFKRQSRQFAHVLEGAGRDVLRLEVPERNHFDIVHDLTGASELARWLPRFAF
jgi:arylformamidase